MIAARLRSAWQRLAPQRSASQLDVYPFSQGCAQQRSAARGIAWQGFSSQRNDWFVFYPRNAPPRSATLRAASPRYASQRLT